MAPKARDPWEGRFRDYVQRLALALGHRDRHGLLREYVTGPYLRDEGKSIEAMAARVDPRHVGEPRQLYRRTVREVFL